MFGTFDNGNKGHLESRELGSNLPSSRIHHVMSGTNVVIAQSGACFRCFGYVATEADMQEIVNEVGGTVDFQQFTHVRPQQNAS